MARSMGIVAGAVGFMSLGIAALLFLLTQITRDRPSLVSHPTYVVTARFENIADLKVGAHVAMSGVNIGRVARIAFDPVDHTAVVEMRFDAKYDRIPADSTAGITTQGILGGKFISIDAGSSDAVLADRGRFQSTHSAIPLENLISRLVARYLKQPAAPQAAGPSSP